MTTFEQIAITIRPRLLELCERFLTMRQLPEEAEDMVQETLFRLWQMRERLDDYASPEALAVTIAKNVCIDLLRRQQVPTNTLHDADDCGLPSGLFKGRKAKFIADGEGDKAESHFGNQLQIFSGGHVSKADAGNIQAADAIRTNQNA